MKVFLKVLCVVSLILACGSVGAVQKQQKQPKKDKAPVVRKVQKVPAEKVASSSSSTATPAIGLKIQARLVHDVAWSPNGEQFAVTDKENIYIWNMPKEEKKDEKTLDNPTFSILNPHGDIIKFLRYSPDGKWLWSGSYDKTLKVWDPATGRIKETIVFPYRLGFIDVSPKGTHVAVAPMNVDADPKIYSTMHLMPLENGIPNLQSRATVALPHGEIIRSMSFHPTSGRLVSASENGILEWEPESSQPARRVLAAKLQKVEYISTQVNSPITMVKHLKSPSLEFQAGTSTSFILSSPVAKSVGLEKVEFSPDGSKGVARVEVTADTKKLNKKNSFDQPGRQYTLVLWEYPFNSPRKLSSMHGKYEVGDLRFLNNDTLISCGHDGKVRTLNLRTKQSGVLFSTETPERLTTLYFSPDRTKVAISIHKMAGTLDGRMQKVYMNVGYDFAVLTLP